MSGDAPRQNATAAPSGTVAFLFTDIEGSTQRWHDHRDAMEAAVRRHDFLMANSITSHGGYIFKTIGDAFCAAFPTVPQAVDAALSAQRRIKAEDWSAMGGLRIRMAVHAGHADERNGDYFGPTVNCVARLLAIGHGEQVLLSAVATDLMKADMPPETSLVDLGLYRLKDSTTPERVYQLVAFGLPSKFAPLQSLDVAPNNLPLQLTAFVGREDEVSEIKQTLVSARLVTLVGAGGVGKTRTALQVAADLLEVYSDGVWFVDLAQLVSPNFVPAAIAAAVNVHNINGSGQLIDHILLALKAKCTLIILDNCEHVVDAVSHATDDILRSCPNVTLLATSREALGIDGEHAYRMPSLAVPEPTKALTANAALEFGSVALFVARAQAAQRTFVLTDSNAWIVADICRRLDGIPLAIELAARRIKALSLEQFAKQLEDRFILTTSSGRTALSRHQTLRALIDWSYDLLGAAEQSMLRQLAVFRGGWTVEAAADVCVGKECSPADVLNLLTSLVDKSLVVADIGGDEPRYRLLESTRHYAFEKLVSLHEHDDVTDRHARWCFRFARRADEGWDSAPEVEWRTEVGAEVDNFRAALHWCLNQRRDLFLGASITSALIHFWRGSKREGRHWLEVAQAALSENAPPSLTASIALGLSWTLPMGPASRAASEQALSAYRSLDDPRHLAWAFFTYAVGISTQETDWLKRAEKAYNEALALADHFGIRRLKPTVLASLAGLEHERGNVAQARATLQRVVTLARKQADLLGESTALSRLSELELAEGNIPLAWSSANRALELDRQRKVDNAVSADLCSLAGLAIVAGDLQAAYKYARDVLIMWERVQQPVQISITLQHLAVVAATYGNEECAAELLGFCDAVMARLNFRREYMEIFGYNIIKPILLQRFGEEELAQRMADGASMDESEAIAEGMRVPMPG
ncbi:MAG: adenylate/guanylate cyclase domain-containing protein [Candidatus Eremiobacteraeota bacterium]|nr:adenylate/guanylate cyclase domain-containing protein [Candidatus Eremiobacteraeota bacterium]